MEIGESIDPFQFFTAFNGKSVGIFHELALGQVDVQHFKKIFPLRENVDFSVIVCDGLIEYVSFSAMVQSFHDFLFPINHIVWTLLKDMAFEVVLVVRLPGLRTHIAKTLATSAGHEVTTHWSLYSLITPRTNLSVLGNPFRIRLLWNNLLDPFALLFAGARVVIIALAAEAEDLAASTEHSIYWSVHLNAVAAINPCTKLVIAVSCDEHFAKSLLKLVQPIFPFSFAASYNALYSLEKDRCGTTLIHASRKCRSTLNNGPQVTHPALGAKAMSANIRDDGDSFITADIAHALLA